MSIVRLVRITAYGQSADKEKVLADLQDRGCLHLIPLAFKEDLLRRAGPSTESREALKFLASCPQKQRQIQDPWTFDAQAVEREALELKRLIEELEDERDLLRVRIRDLRPFGDFTFSPVEEMGNLRLWFYVVPHGRMAELAASDYIWEVMSRDNRFSYVTVIAESEPEEMPVPRAHTGSTPLADLSRRLEEVERQLEDRQADRAVLTRWIHLFTRSIYQLEDQAELVSAGGQTFDEEEVFALQAWAPKREIPKLRAYADEQGIALEVEKPSKEEVPPTLLSNRKVVASGQDLVSFYTTPNYWLWDPSGIVFFSFAVFFAMIIADAAYGLVLGVIMGLLWMKMGRSPTGKRLRLLGCVLVVATVIYGVMVGSYFGVSPPPTSFLHHLKIIDINNFAMMMKISIIIGILHLVVANAADAWRWRWSFAMLAPIGWMCMWIGAFLLWRGLVGDPHPLALDTVGIATMATGGVFILFFTSTRGPIWKRIMKGLLGLARLSSAFGDTLSYLRLFALGLASASLAMTFNELAREVGEGVPGIGFLLSLLIIILGHGLNLLLGCASGVIHGLRLNFIEFFNWGMPEEGYPFRAFERKEKSSWTT